MATRWHGWRISFETDFSLFCREQTPISSRERRARAPRVSSTRTTEVCAYRCVRSPRRLTLTVPTHTLCTVYLYIYDKETVFFGPLYATPFGGGGAFSSRGDEKPENVSGVFFDALRSRGGRSEGFGVRRALPRDSATSRTLSSAARACARARSTDGLLELRGEPRRRRRRAAAAAARTPRATLSSRPRVGESSRRWTPGAAAPRAIASLGPPRRRPLGPPSPRPSDAPGRARTRRRPLGSPPRQTRSAGFRSSTRRAAARRRSGRGQPPPRRRAASASRRSASASTRDSRAIFARSSASWRATVAAEKASARASAAASAAAARASARSASRRASRASAFAAAARFSAASSALLFAACSASPRDAERGVSRGSASSLDSASPASASSLDSASSCAASAATARRSRSRIVSASDAALVSPARASRAAPSARASASATASAASRRMASMSAVARHRLAHLGLHRLVRAAHGALSLRGGLPGARRGFRLGGGDGVRRLGARRPRRGRLGARRRRRGGRLSLDDARLGRGQFLPRGAFDLEDARACLSGGSLRGGDARGGNSRRPRASPPRPVRRRRRRLSTPRPRLALSPPPPRDAPPRRLPAPYVRALRLV